MNKLRENTVGRVSPQDVTRRDDSALPGGLSGYAALTRPTRLAEVEKWIMEMLREVME